MEVTQKVSVNKNLFSQKLNDRDYNYCLSILRNEIITLLSNKIKEKNPQFTYTTVNSLKNGALQYLSEEDKNIAIDFFTISFEDNSPEVELYSIMDLYKNLCGTDEF